MSYGSKGGVTTLGDFSGGEGAGGGWPINYNYNIQLQLIVNFVHGQTLSSLQWASSALESIPIFGNDP